MKRRDQGVNLKTYQSIEVDRAPSFELSIDRLDE